MTNEKLPEEKTTLFAESKRIDLVSKETGDEKKKFLARVEEYNNQRRIVFANELRKEGLFQCLRCRDKVTVSPTEKMGLLDKKESLSGAWIGGSSTFRLGFLCKACSEKMRENGSIFSKHTEREHIYGTHGISTTVHTYTETFREIEERDHRYFVKIDGVQHEIDFLFGAVSLRQDVVERLSLQLDLPYLMIDSSGHLSASFNYSWDSAVFMEPSVKL